MATTKKKTAGTKRKAKKTPWYWRWLPPMRWVLYFALILITVMAVWVYTLDQQVTSKFDGKKWAIPARVYARPLELYEGLLIKPAELERELKGLGYQFVKQVQQPGQVSKQGGRYNIYARGFDFADKTEKSARYSVRLGAQQVLALTGADDDLVLRLDPKEIGSIYPNHGEDRILITLANVPPLLGEALIAVEDKDFARHHGVSIKGIVRAMVANIKSGGFVQGGSTLTQQLVKNFYLTHERKLWRKIQEAVMAVLLEVRYSKADILQAYMNEVYLGQSGPRAIHGFGLAAQHYFSRSIKNLQPHQIALLVATAKGASYYNPWRYPERAKQRRDLVLTIMAEHQLISSADGDAYKQKPLGVVQKSQLRLGDYPAFLDLVKRQLKEDYQAEDLQSEGLRIFTTMSPNVQELTELAVASKLKALNKHQQQGDLQTAAVITAVGSGEVLAVVGDRNPRYSGFNRALDIQRPIGSLVKPFVYLTALAKPNEYTLMTLLDDSEVIVDLPNGTQWKPQNFSLESHGDVPLYKALASSYNQSTARLGMAVGLKNVSNTLAASGLKKTSNALPSMLLGALNLSPLEVSHLYHTVAADGVYTPLRAIRSVQDAENKPLQRYALASEPRIPPELSYLMHYNLQAVMRTGTGRRAYRQLPSDLIVAGKTGTSNQQRDSWFAGYSGDHLGVVWVGRDNNQPTVYTGSSGALPVWMNVFDKLSTVSVANDQPETIEYYWVDSVDGLLSAENCQGAQLVPFIAGSQPAEKTNCESLDAPVTRWFKRWFR